ncbi:hypothetical protein [Nonomuraea sp. NPDC049684]|uniref:hypothetical protein n=1 Tax=unclassified Nonomuraea TaxID=2593643 RepID=UPI00378B5754
MSGVWPQPHPPHITSPARTRSARQPYSTAACSRPGSVAIISVACSVVRSPAA